MLSCLLQQSNAHVTCMTVLLHVSCTYSFKLEIDSTEVCHTQQCFGSDDNFCSDVYHVLFGKIILFLFCTHSQIVFILVFILHSRLTLIVTSIVCLCC